VAALCERKDYLILKNLKCEKEIMKKFFTLFVLVFYFTACGPGSGFQVSSLSPQTDIAPPPVTGATYELYSWYNGQDWAYSLFESATKVSSFAEITNSNDIIIGTQTIADHLLQLPKGSKVYWNLKRIKGFSFPDYKTVERVQSTAKKAFIQLEIIAWPV
jgi:hypothetical protein